MNALQVVSSLMALFDIMIVIGTIMTIISTVSRDNKYMIFSLIYLFSSVIMAMWTVSFLDVRPEFLGQFGISVYELNGIHPLGFTEMVVYSIWTLIFLQIPIIGYVYIRICKRSETKPESSIQ